MTWIFATLIALGAMGCKGSTDASEIPARFKANIHPFLKSTCSASACHSSANPSGPAGGVDLSASADEVHAAIQPWVDKEDILESKILVFPLNSNEQHFGGRIFQDVEDENFLMVAKWLHGGAKND